MLALDAAHWHGWFGAGVIAWLFRNTPGNLAASIIWAAPAGWGVWRKAIRPHLERIHAHNAWMSEIQAIQHQAVTGVEAPPHP